MGTKLFVGSLAWATSDSSLQNFFSQVGNVVSAKVIMDRNTGRSRGFGFVEFATAEEAQKAIDELNGKELDGRQITVNEAKPQENRPSGGGHGGFRRDNRDFKRGGYDDNR